MEPPPPPPPSQPEQPPPSTSSQPSTPLPSDPSPSQPPPSPSLPPHPQQPPLQQPIYNPNPTNTFPSYSQQPPQPPPQPQPQPQPPIPYPNPINTLTSYVQQPSQQPPLTRPFSHSQFHSSSTSTVSSPSLLPRLGIAGGGYAIGVPAVSSQPPLTTAASFSSSFGAHYGGAAPALPQNPADNSTVPSSAPSQARPDMHGTSGMGMIGSQIRSSALHPQRPVQALSGIRPQAASSNMSSIPQNFQGHGVLRASSVTALSTSTSNTSQSEESPNRPWLSSSQGCPPLPSQSVRPQANSQLLQQRSHIPQQSPHPMHSSSQQVLPSSQHFPASNLSQDNYGQQLSSSRVTQPLANQQQPASLPRVQGSTNQRPPSPGMGQPSIGRSVSIDNLNAAEVSEPCNTILSKRNIQELVNQIDPSEKLDPEVEDVLVDIAEDFIDSVTTFGCSLAKHRKSSTLEAKDILLHLERTWNMTLPGYGGDEIKTFKKPVVNDIHKERLALIKKSHAGAEMGSTKPSVGPATGNVKGHLAKA